VTPVAPQLSLYGGGGVDAEISPAAARAVDTDLGVVERILMGAALGRLVASGIYDEL